MKKAVPAPHVIQGYLNCHDMSLKEIAAMYGVSVKAIENSLYGK